MFSRVRPQTAKGEEMGARRAREMRREWRTGKDKGWVGGGRKDKSTSPKL
jgi:hypothetical protein